MPNQIQSRLRDIKTRRGVLQKESQRKNIEDNFIKTGKADACMEFELPNCVKQIVKNRCGSTIYQIIQSQPIDNYDEEVRWYQVYAIGPRKEYPIPWDDKNGKSYFYQGVCVKKPEKSISRTVSIKCPLP